MKIKEGGKHSSLYYKDVQKSGSVGQEIMG